MFSKFLSLFFKNKTNIEPVFDVKAINSVVSAAPSAYSYLANDPTTPKLVQNVKLPTINQLRFNVKGFNVSPKNSNEKQALNCYVNIGNSINAIQPVLKSTIKNWASTSVLNVYPQAGRDLNAFYDRSSLRFFYYPTSPKAMYTADSADVVAHELGHALLDAMRPDFWSVQALEIWSFHEAFSDIFAIFSIMQYDVILNKMLEETGNDISKSNVVSRLAEEFGLLIYKLGGKQTGSLADCLRNPAVEKYVYIDPNSLPSDGRDDQLLAESHSFGRVFTAVWYKILVEIYKKELMSKTPINALKSARDIAFTALAQAIPSSARVSNYYNSIAVSMVNVAKIKYPTYQSLINQIFIEWNIINASPIKMLSNVNYKELVSNIKKNDQVIKNSKFTTIRIVENKLIKLNSISALSNNKLNNIEVEIPSDKYYEFDKSGNLVNEIVENEDHVMKDVELCVQNIERSSSDMWVVKDGKLLRNYIV